MHSILYQSFFPSKRLKQSRQTKVSTAASSASAAAMEGPLLHRRNLSLEELAGEVGLSHDRRLRVPLPKARSVRAFACIGAA
ncbi:unnamed protein product [Urochloa humidicola]